MMMTSCAAAPPRTGAENGRFAMLLLLLRPALFSRSDALIWECSAYDLR